MISNRTSLRALLASWTFLIPFTCLSQPRIWSQTVNGGQGYGTIFSIAPNGTNLQIHKTFSGDIKGSKPGGGELIKADDGDFYGVAAYGGDHNNGVIFKISATDLSYEKIFDFGGNLGIETGRYPWGALVQASNGHLYGMAGGGASNSRGVIFKVSTTGSGFSKLLDFNGNNGTSPSANASLIQCQDGNLYGAVGGGTNGKGVIFKIDLLGNYTKLLDLDNTTGANPVGSLMEGSDGKLYGMTLTNANNRGTVFRINYDGTSYMTLHEFANVEGDQLAGGLVESGGKLFGVARSGGAHGKGVVFSVSLSGTYQKLHDFDGTSGGNPEAGLALGDDGKLYGGTTLGGTTDAGVIYSVEQDGSNFTVLSNLGVDGSWMVSRPTRLDANTFLSVCRNGGLGTSGKGTVISFDTDGDFSKVLDFFSENDGQSPNLMILTSSGYIVGGTREGGTHNLGTLYKLDANGNGFVKLKNFDGANGGWPAQLWEGPDGFIYGTTVTGGANKRGVLFRLFQNGTGFTKLYDFPSGSLPGLKLELVGENLTATIGQLGDGNVVLFQTSANGIDFKRILSFSTPDAIPTSGLLPLDDGHYYGTTVSGGTNGFGTIFKVDSDLDNFQVIHDFDQPLVPGPLVRSPNGFLLGCTLFGGASNAGLIYRINTDGTQFQKLIEFASGLNSNTGALPVGGLSDELGGFLYGFTSTGQNGGFPSLYKIGSDAQNFEVLASFNASSPLSTGVHSKPLIVSGKQLQQITFNPLRVKSPDDPPFNIEANATSGLAITYTSSNPDVATVDGNRITIIGAGVTTITATQSGNAGYYAAPNVQQELRVSRMEDYFHLVGSTISGAHGLGSLVSINSTGSQFSVLKAFDSNPNGSNPGGALLQGNDGFFYGVGHKGGVNGKGVVYKLNSDGSAYEILHSFNDLDGEGPVGKLVQASNGFLYGVTTFGGENDIGTIYRIRTDGTGFTKLRDFDVSGGYYPQSGLIQASNGILYGVTVQGGSGGNGVIFKLNMDGTGFANIATLNSIGAGPQGGLLQSTDGKLYGVCSGGGTQGTGIIYRINLDGTGLQKMADFTGANGAFPICALALGLDGKIYGTTLQGGAFGRGTIFRVNSDGSNLTKIFDFDGIVGAEPGSLLYTTANKLLGATASGGTNRKGAIFQINPNGSSFSNLVNFNGTNGSGSWGSLIESNTGDFFGSSGSGALSNDGVIFKLTSSGAYTKLKEFYGELGQVRSQLIRADDGFLYGMSAAKGQYGNGILFKIKPDGTGYQKLKDLEHATTGGSAEGTLLEASNGALYGLTKLGGANNDGTAFRINKDGSGFAKLHDFSFANGSNPRGTLIELANGVLVGTTDGGGANNSGVLFKISLDGTGFSVLYNFDYQVTGGGPGDLILTESGHLLGMSSYGGANGKGNVFRIGSDGTGFSKLLDFNGDNGGDPVGGFVKVSAHEFIGATRTGGAYGRGAIFKINDDGSGFQVLQSLSPVSGQSPLFGSLTLAPDGFLYGMAGSGGTNSSGTIFKLRPDGDDFTKLYDLNEPVGNYPFAAGLTLVVKAAQKIFFPEFGVKTFGVAPFAVGATVDSGLPLTFESSDPSVAEVISGSVIVHKAGIVIIRAKQQGNLNYSPAATQRTLVIQKANQVLDFSPIATKVFGSAPFTLTATVDSGLPITLVSLDDTRAKVQGNVVTILQAGNVSIKAVQAGNDNFNAAEVTRSFTIEKATQTISFDALSEKKYNEKSFDLLGQSTSGLEVVFVSSNLSIATVVGKKVNLVGIGSCTITATQTGNLNYLAAAPVERALTVAKGDQAITFNSIPTKKITEKQFELIASATSNLPVTFSSTDVSVATINGNIVSLVGLGSTQITATQNGDDKYNAAPAVSHTLTISKAEQTITFLPLPVKTFGDEPLSLSAQSSSGLPVAFESSNTEVATVAGNTVTLVSAGIATITATQSGGTDYLAAPAVEQVLTIKKAQQTISFAALPVKTLGDPDFELTATVSSKLPIQFTADDKITINGSVVKLVKAGRTTIKANQPGDKIYEPANEVVQTVCINPAKPTISQTDAVLASSSDNGNRWYLEGQPIADGNQKQLTTKVGGTYTVRVQVDDCISQPSDPVVLVITGDLHDNKEVALEIYPNPVDDAVVFGITSDEEVPIIYSILDLMGRTMVSGKATTNKGLSLNLARLTSGTYFMRVQTTEEVYSKKFIKR